MESLPKKQNERDSTYKDKVHFLQAYLNCHWNIRRTCDAVGISRETFYQWNKNDAEFASQLKKLQELELQYVENKLMDLIEAGNTAATTFYLKSRHPNYMQKTKIEVVSSREQSYEEMIAEEEEGLLS
jgi:hypothetical protein